MSSAEQSVRHHRHHRHHKRQTDRAISQAYARLAADARAVAAFHELLQCVRARARGMFDAAVVNGHHPGVEALVNLSRVTEAHVRKIRDWPGTPVSTSWRPAVAALVEYLLCRFATPPPRFMAAAWCASASAEHQRQWYIAHARGACFRSLDLPIAMTRKMEHIFLTSPHHLDIAHAMRRAELIALGASDEVVRAVLATPVAADLRNGDFWRTVWTFLIVNAHAIETTQIGPMIDFIQAIRHEHRTVETQEGYVIREPPQPSFSMKGRTGPSMMRLMYDWHRSLGVMPGGLTWEPSPLRPMLIEEPGVDPDAPPIVWQMIELTNGTQLRTEGSKLRHCVGSYATRCWRGRSHIWSLRAQRGDRLRHILTIEVDIHKRVVIQARGWRNRPASGKALRLLQEWTARERLRLLSTA